LFINYNDHVFARQFLDDDSLNFAKNNLKKFSSDPLLRHLLWGVFYDMNRDGQMNPADFLKLVRENIETENDKKLVQTLMGRAISTIFSFVPDKYINEEAEALFNVAWKIINEAKSTEDCTIWGNTVVSLAKTSQAIQILSDWLNGKVKLINNNEYELDQSLRWRIISILVSRGCEGAIERVDEELKRDKSDNGKRAASGCVISQPKEDVKEAAWKRFLEFDTKSGEGSLHAVCAEMSGFGRSSKKELLIKYVDGYFHNAKKIATEKSLQFARAWLSSLFPSWLGDNEELLKRCEKLLEECTEDDKLLKKSLLQQMDDLKRSIKCKAKYVPLQST